MISMQDNPLLKYKLEVAIKLYRTNIRHGEIQKGAPLCRPTWFELRSQEIQKMGLSGEKVRNRIPWWADWPGERGDVLFPGNKVSQESFDKSKSIFSYHWKPEASACVCWGLLARMLLATWMREKKPSWIINVLTALKILALFLHCLLFSPGRPLISK